MLTSTTDFPMPIETPRLILIPPVLSNNNVQEYCNAVLESMNEISLWLPWAKYPPSIEQAKTYIEACNKSWQVKDDNNIGLPLWLVEKNSDRFIGNITIWNIAWEIPKFEFGYWIRTSETGKGYITEAVNALTRYSFLELGVNRIEIRSEKENLRAQQVPKKLFFNLDGIMPKNTLAVADGRLTDVVLFSCTNLDHLPKLEVKW
jgi:ribosomal-protein-serine acetyltransferase